MHEQPPEEQPGDDRELEPKHEPRVYIASLSDYNDGRLHGEWLDATADPDDLYAGTRAMLARSPEPNAEEWAIHDYDDFAGLRLGEYESFENVSRLAKGIAAHGEAFATYAEYIGTDEATEEGFTGCYRGRWESVAAYAADWLDDMGASDALAGLPEWLRPHVHLDVEGFGRDLQLGGDIYTAEASGGGVHVFDS